MTAASSPAAVVDDDWHLLSDPFTFQKLSAVTDCCGQRCFDTAGTALFNLTTRPINVTCRVAVSRSVILCSGAR